ncbi:MAG: hypothetical protein MI757_01620, partial [Pirellulales bacterium]|nr:hypothetical protein [Pirellulales bacterium]
MAKKKTTRRSRRRASTRKRNVSRKSEVDEGRGDEVSGFNLSDQELEDALISGQHRNLLEIYLGEQQYAELQSLAARSRARSVRGGPRVLVLPGIMGSKLGTRGRIRNDTIWFDPFDIARGNLTELRLNGGPSNIQPLGVILAAYLRMKLRLRIAGFDADFHAFDWRKSIDAAGKLLADRILKETHAATGTRELYLVAHSMGGLVGRSALFQLDGEVDRVHRLVMLGTPNFGSFAPVQALRATYSTIRKVAALDLSHTAEELATEVFSGFAGLYQMLPSREKFSGVDLFDPATWPDDGPQPRPSILRSAPKIHEKLLGGSDQMTLIAGVGQETTTDMRVVSGQFEYESSFEGDGTVPLEFAILPNVVTHYIEEAHGSLPNNKEVIRSVIDLLETGTTDRLPTSWSPRRRGIIARRDDGQLASKEPFDGRTGRELSPREVRHLIDEFAAPPTATTGTAPVAVRTGESQTISSEPIIVGRRRQHRIDLRLARGNIVDVDARAIVVGLFDGVPPAGPALAIDARVDGAVTELTERRMFSGGVGEVFIMPTGRHAIKCEMVAFAGMGAFDEFDDEVLRLTAENVARTLVRTRVDEFATVLIGSKSVSDLRNSLTCMIDGFFRGLLDADDDHRMRSITLCEMDGERFEQVKNELLQLTTTPLFDEVEVTVELIDLPSTAQAPATSARRERADVDSVHLIVRQKSTLVFENESEVPVPSERRLTFQSSLLGAGNKATVLTDDQLIDRNKLARLLERIETTRFTFDNLQEFGTELA